MNGVAEHEKSNAALSSVAAAVGLTGLKLVVGMLTGSLGILAEAAHSGLDLVAAMTTWWAVRISDKPADPDHLYGHGKVENLSALFETVLLLITCAWIVYEAVDRLLFHHTIPEVTYWSFVVMTVSVVVDVSRSRMLFRAAKKHQSQALEADALHFSTDIWSSLVVIAGLFGVLVGRWIPALEFMHHTDAVAALMVALIVFQISYGMGKRSVQALLDTAPLGLEERIKEAVGSMPGVKNCHQVRMRYSGPKLFVDIHAVVDGEQTLRAAHYLTDQIETIIQAQFPNADVTVHPEPDQENGED